MHFTRILSIFVIAAAAAITAIAQAGSNQKFTALETRKNFNADLLLTYQVNPWTALYVGYNSNLPV
jgi:hypothetical protein